ncbi:hypothetical protein MA16_Dca009620 [Dendrobium catenatum]|uniref:Uncharacterized protein n=1 Tax=Dendrobium catenatum TaxID=906689 RepID=A0A2I0VSJ9_9ASPA|nr:hypothetical protein MA16_Dca009620 [Dendrobium catenatum]
MNLPLCVNVINVSHQSSPHQTFFFPNSITAQIRLLFIETLIEIRPFQNQRKKNSNQKNIR